MECKVGDHIMIDVLSKRDRIFFVVDIVGETVKLAGGVSEIRIHETRVCRNVTAEMNKHIKDTDDL